MSSSPEVFSASAGYEADQEAESFTSSGLVVVDLEDDKTVEETANPIFLNGVTWAKQSLKDIRPKTYPSLMNLGGRKRKRRMQTGKSRKSSSIGSTTHSCCSATSSSEFCSCSSCCSDDDDDTTASENTLVTESIVDVPSSPYQPRPCRARRIVYDSDGQEDSCLEIYEGNTCCRTHGQYPHRYRSSYKDDDASVVNANATPLPFFSTTHLPMAPASGITAQYFLASDPLNNPWPVPNPLAVTLPTMAAMGPTESNPYLMALLGLFRDTTTTTKAAANNDKNIKNAESTPYNGLVVAAANDMLKCQQEENKDAFYVVLSQPFSIAQSLSFSPCPRLLLEATAPHHVVHHNAAYESLEGAERAPNVFHVGYPTLEQAIADLCTRHPAMPRMPGDAPRTAVHVHPILTEAIVTHYLLEVVASGSQQPSPYRNNNESAVATFMKETEPNGARTIVG